MCTERFLSFRPSEEEAVDVNTLNKEEEDEGKTKGPQLSRKNSSKNLVSHLL